MKEAKIKVLALLPMELPKEIELDNNRLKNIQLGYSLPKKLMQAAKLGGLRIYVQAENPLTWNKYRKGWDPEINTGGQYYPILATYTFGVNFNF